MKVLAFDPGKTTGWALVADTGEILDWGEVALSLDVEFLIQESKPDLVVYEDFVLYQFKAQAQAWKHFDPVEVIGVIKHICLCHEIECQKQMAWQAKRVEIDPKPKGSKHAYDAMRHALVALARMGHEDARNKLRVQPLKQETDGTGKGSSGKKRG